MTVGNVATGEGGWIAVALIEDSRRSGCSKRAHVNWPIRSFLRAWRTPVARTEEFAGVDQDFAQLLPERHDDKEFREQFSTTVTNEVNRVDVLVTT